MNDRTSDKISIIRQTDMSPKETSLIKLAYQNETQKIATFLDKNPDTDIINMSDRRCYSLAHISSLNSNIPLFEILLQFIRDQNRDKDEAVVKEIIKTWINKRNDEGFSPLHFCSFKGNLKFIKKLEELGADINASNNHGLNVLHIAAQGDQPISLYYWRMKRLNINSKDKKGSTPLHWAAYLGCENALNYLTTWESDIHMPDDDGHYTPLHLAVISGNSRVVRKLLIRGADREKRDKQGKKPSDLARENDYHNIYTMIEDTKYRVDLCNINPQLRPMKKTKKSLFLFFLIFFGAHLFSYLFVFPYIDQEIYTHLYLIFGLVALFFFSVSWLRDPGYLRNSSRRADPLDFLELLERYDCSNLCPECEILKPPRSRHCEICHSCVSVFDHHCPWISNCVGTRNHKYFLLFIFTMWLDIINFLVLTISHITVTRTKFLYISQWSDFADEQFYYYKLIVSTILILMSCFFFIPLSLLFWIHVNNFLMNKTTSERFGFNNLQSRSDNTSRKESSSDTNYVAALEVGRSKNLIQEKPRYKSRKFTCTEYIQNCYAMCFRNSDNRSYYQSV